MYMTEDERKKIRRRRRLEKEREKQDKIKLGLLEPPKEKLKMKTFMLAKLQEGI
jgi:U4/U6 small nuclear ribonucleoprotein PRP3